MTAIKLIERFVFVQISTVITLIYYFGYNMYFGWNKEPESFVEEGFDTVFMFLVAFIIVTFLDCIYEYFIYQLKKDL